MVSADTKRARRVDPDFFAVKLAPGEGRIARFGRGFDGMSAVHCSENKTAGSGPVWHTGPLP
jgi:hypothetical protein